MDLGGIKIKRFADGEIYVQVQVRDLHKYLLAEHRPVKSPTRLRSFHTCRCLNGRCFHLVSTCRMKFLLLCPFLCAGIHSGL